MAEDEQERGASEPPVRGLLIDLDGVVYVGNSPIAGAIEALRGLRDRRVPIRFVTNTSTKPVHVIEDKLAGLGIEPAPREVFSPVQAAVAALTGLGARAPYLVVDERIAPAFGALSPAGLFPERPAASPDFIVVGDIGRRWDYELMNSLFAMVGAGARIIALHKGRSWQTPDGLALDIGAFVAGLEYASGTEALVMGKPSEDFFRAAVSDMGIASHETVMIGDDIDSDIAGAQSAGIRGVLVQTGKYRREYVERSPITPWRTLGSLADVESLPGLGGEVR